MAPRSHAAWVDRLDPTERDALDVAHARALSESDRRADVLVVGGGMVGLATALACQQAGLGRVVLLERDRLGGGATGGAAGILAPDAHHGDGPPDLVDLGRESLAAWRRIDASMAGGLGLRDVDWLVSEPLPPGLDSRPPPGAVPVPELRSFDPALASTDAGMLLPGQARVNPLGAAARLGRRVGTVVTGVEVSDVACSNGRVVKVSTTAGELSPGVVVFATGAPPGLPRLELSSPCGFVKGHLIVTEPAPVRLRAAADGVIQLEDGSLMAGGTLDQGDSSPDVRPDVVESVRGALDEAVPAARGLGTTHAWCCFRPATTDRLPVVDKAPGLTNAWLTFGHYRTGILLAPATGEALASWVDSGERPPLVQPLGLERVDARPTAGR